MVFRVSRIDYGTLENGVINVFAIEDIFTDYSGVFDDPPVSSHTDPEEAPVAPVSADTLIFEAPRQMIIQDVFDSGLFPRVWAGARDPGGGTVAFQIYSRFGTSPLSGSFDSDSSIGVFLIAGELDAALPAYGASDSRPATDYDIVVTNNDPDDLAALETSDGPSRVRSLRNILYIDGEFIGYEIIELDGSVYDVRNLYRGLFHTAPKAHAAGTRVWFLGQSGGNLTSNSIMTNPDGELKLRSMSFTQILAEAAVPTESISLDDLHRVPLAPHGS
jgi:hypothetical protein